MVERPEDQTPIVETVAEDAQNPSIRVSIGGNIAADATHPNNISTSDSGTTPSESSQQPPRPQTAAAFRVPWAQSRGRHIHARTGNRVFTVPLQRQNIQAVNGFTTPHTNSVNVHIMQMDPLIPQPVADASGNNASTNHDDTDDESMARFKCDVCYEYLRDPVGCGNCSSRFCRDCLARVYRDESRRHQQHKCPMCRVEYEQMVPDRALNHDLNNGPTLPCRYDGCPEQALALSMIAEHEKRCEHVPMRCRYAPYGCSWTGKRGMIQAHESDDCRVAPLSPLVEQVRQIPPRLDVVGQQALGTLRMQDVHRQNLVRDQMKSIVDVFQLLQYCYCLTCSAPLFMYTKEKWVSYWKSSERRAAVANFLVFLPLSVASLKAGSYGVTTSCLLLDKLLMTATKVMTEKLNTTSSTLESIASSFLTPQTERLSEDAFLGICAGILGAMTILLNFLDEKSSKSWRGIEIRYMGNAPVVCDMLAISSFTLFVIVMESRGAGIQAWLQWLLIFYASTFFPALIMTLSHHAAGSLQNNVAPTASNMVSLARSIEPILFGLRYSFLATCFGMSACLDAVVIVGLLPRTAHDQCLKDCFVGQLPESLCFLFLGAKVAMWGADLHTSYLSPTKEESMFQVLFVDVADSVFATVVLRVLNSLVYALFALGVKLAGNIVRTSSGHIRPDGAAKEYNVLGIFAFGSWALSLFLLTQV